MPPRHGFGQTGFGRTASTLDEMGLREAFSAALDQSLTEKVGNRLGFLPWALRVPEPKAGMLDFEAFPMQREMYAEAYDDREMVIKKGTQVGVSAWAVRWALYHCDLRGLTCLYIFPTQQDVFDFGDARVKPVIEASDYLRGRVLPDDPSNKGLRKIGLGFIYFRGSESKRKLDSVDADLLVIDEYDTVNAANIPDAERRLSGPLSKGLIRRVGVPSIPGWGIARAYDESDQRQWHVKCQACGDYQPISFHENVDQLRAIIVCRKCTKPLNVAKGEWVAAFPDRDVRGYHVTRLLAPGANIQNIVKASKKRSPIDLQVFHNKDLGEEYAPAEGRLSLEAIQAAQSAGGGYVTAPGFVGPELVTMGVDVASTRALNVRISQHLPDDESKIALFIGEVDNFNDLGRLMDRYGVKMAAIDHLPEGRLARSFAEQFPGRVFIVAYDTTPTPKNPDVLRVDEGMRFCTVRRTEAMDATGELIRSQKNKLPLNLPEGYVDAMQAPVRVATKDELGRVAVSYKSMGSDDYYHAELFDLVATELFYFRMHRDEQDREVLQPLENMLEFQRSALAEYEDGEYAPGGQDGEYYAGGK